MRAVWPDGRSGLGELLNFDYQTLSLMQMYRASDALMKHRQAVRGPPVHPGHGIVRSAADRDAVRSDQHLLRRGGQPSTQAQRGHSKDKRSDCQLLTLGLVLDGAGFVRHSEVFAGRGGEQGRC